MEVAVGFWIVKELFGLWIPPEFATETDCDLGDLAKEIGLDGLVDRGDGAFSCADGLEEVQDVVMALRETDAKVFGRGESE